MNQYAKAVIGEFTSKENRIYCGQSLQDHFNNKHVNAYLQDHLDSSIHHFANLIEQELRLNMPMPGVTIMNRLNCFNNQFIRDRINFIRAHVIVDDAPIAYAVNDGLPTGRHCIKHYQQPANTILDSWRVNSGRGIQAREDPGGDISQNTFATGASGYNLNIKKESSMGNNCSNGANGMGANGMGNYREGFTGNNGMGNYREGFTGNGMGNNGFQSAPYLQTGIMFCDQKHLGTANHLNQYENTLYKHNLNQTHRPHEATAFGVSTPAADARLESRRTFRSEGGVENAIPRYEVRLQRRNIERDISEGLVGTEKGCIQFGHDMSSLRARIDHKNAVKTYYAPNKGVCINGTYPVATNQQLWKNSAVRPSDLQSMQYC